MTNFIKPVRRLSSPQDVERWMDSSTCKEILEFIVELQESVVGLENDSEVYASEKARKLMEIMIEVNKVAESNPVIVDKDVSRFGKVEFRDFYDEVSKKSSEWSRQLLDVSTNENCVIELTSYFNESWGNRTRIDYGSGHELNLILFLLCLKKLNLITKEDYSFLILKVFTKYISIMRTLQKTYWLEPAGSHGVWGLDDYHFLPFLFGASQLSTHPFMKPKSIHNTELVEQFYEKYMYFECIHFINSIKTIPRSQTEKLSLRWHSPMLDDISSAKSWLKIKEGMIKMYKAEILAKLPIVQHIMFGSLVECPEGISKPHDNLGDGCSGHAHESTNTWGDCCGIKIPSAIAASESLKLSEKQHFKPVPFD